MDWLHTVLVEVGEEREEELGRDNVEKLILTDHLFVDCLNVFLALPVSLFSLVFFPFYLSVVFRKAVLPCSALMHPHKAQLLTLSVSLCLHPYKADH